MAYSKKNMITTLKRAKVFLKAGFIRGQWQCRKNGNYGKPCFIPGEVKCCAEGAIQLACGHWDGKGPQRARNYSSHLISHVAEHVPNGIALYRYNDSHDYYDVAKVFDSAIKSLK